MQMCSSFSISDNIITLEHGHSGHSVVHITWMTVTRNLQFPHYSGSCNTFALHEICPQMNSYCEFITCSFLTLTNWMEVVLLFVLKNYLFLAVFNLLSCVDFPLGVASEGYSLVVKIKQHFHTLLIYFIHRNFIISFVEK